MKQEARSHFIYHISLISILTIGAVAFFALDQNRTAQVIIASFTCFSYSLWGILHHYVNHSLFPKIVVEYILIGLLALSIILFILQGGLGI